MSGANRGSVGPSRQKEDKVSHATQLKELLDLQRQPVAVRFQDSVPEGISRINDAAVSGLPWHRADPLGRQSRPVDPAPDRGRGHAQALTRGADQGPRGNRQFPDEPETRAHRPYRSALWSVRAD